MVKERNTTQLRAVSTGAHRSDGYRPTRNIEDIRGIATVKRNLQEIIDLTKARRHHKTSEWLGGMLLYGPVGCGKVFSVEVVASELQATMHLFDVSAGWHRKTFEQTLRQAVAGMSDTLMIALHFENIDTPAATTLMTPMLDYLDKKSASGNLIITGSATLPWQVSRQLAQAGRLDHVLLVLPPDGPSRARFILEHLAENAEISDDDLNWLVDRTEGHTFTELRHLVDTATEKSNSKHIERSALRAARRDISPDSAQWLSQAGHHALMNKAGGMYDDLLQYFHMRQHM